MSNENDNVLTPAQKRLIEESLLIEQQEAIDAGSVGYMARVLTQAKLKQLCPIETLKQKFLGVQTVH